MTKIETTNAPGAIGPYSQGMKSGKLVFTSGQIPLDPATGTIVGDTIEAQSEQALKNLRAVLEAGGASLSTVVKTTTTAANPVSATLFIDSPFFTTFFITTREFASLLLASRFDTTCGEPLNGFECERLSSA